MIKILLLMSVLICTVCKAATLEQAFSSLSLKPQASISGQFIQRKNITILKHALVSEGDFSAQSSGFVWRQNSPVKSLIRMDKRGVFSQDHLGHEQEMVGAAKYIPLLQGLLLQNTTVLDEFLQVERVETPCILLKTKAPINQIYQSVRLCGQKRVSQIVLYEQAGHTTEIDLSYADNQ